MLSCRPGAQIKDRSVLKTINEHQNISIKQSKIQILLQLHSLNFSMSKKNKPKSETSNRKGIGTSVQLFAPQKVHLKQSEFFVCQTTEVSNIQLRASFLHASLSVVGGFGKIKHAGGFHDGNIHVTESQVILGPCLFNKKSHANSFETGKKSPVKSTKIACLVAFFSWACCLACPRTIFLLPDELVIPENSYLFLQA